MTFGSVRSLRVEPCRRIEEIYFYSSKRTYTLTLTVVKQPLAFYLDKKIQNADGLTAYSKPTLDRRKHI